MRLVALLEDKGQAVATRAAPPAWYISRVTPQHGAHARTIRIHLPADGGYGDSAGGAMTLVGMHAMPDMAHGNHF